jgi:hypothetical protein
VRVIVDGRAGRVEAEDADNLGALSVVLRDVTPDRAAALLGEFGQLDGEHVWLNIESLRELAPHPQSCSWGARFQQAMDYATSKGWTDPGGAFVRAHIEATP